MLLLLTKYQSQEETDESRPLFKVFRYSFSEANDRYFSIALNVFFSLSDSDKIFTYDWLYIEICQNVGFSKTDIVCINLEKLN